MDRCAENMVLSKNRETAIDFVGKQVQNKSNG